MSDFTPIPRPSLFGVVRRATAKVLGDLLLAALVVAGVALIVYTGDWALDRYPALVITVGLVLAFGGCVAWRAFELYDAEQRMLIDQETARSRS